MKPWQLIPLLVFLLLSFFLWRGLSLDPRHLPSSRLGKQLPQFSLPELESPKQIVHRSAFKHRVSLLNVWASWCQACTEEQPFMMQLAGEGVLIHGLNYKDKSEDALQWLANFGDPYQLILQDLRGKLAMDLGVYGAPETFVIDKQGVIRYRHVGVMTQAVWQQQIRPLMQDLERQS